MLSPEHVFFTSIRRLGDKYIYPFHLYLYHPLKKKCFLYLEANSPLTPERKSMLSYFERNGAKLAVKKDQKETFDRYLKDVALRSFAIVESLWELDELVSEAKIEIAREKNLASSEELSIALQKDNFEKLIRLVQIQILSLETDFSNLKLAKILALNCLTHDTTEARIIVINYLLGLKLKDINLNARLESFIASCLSELGELSFSAKLATKAYNELNENEKKTYRSHPLESLTILKNLEISLTPLSELIIIEHHERWNGSGYPHQKSLKKNHLLGLTLAMATHFVEYASGRILKDKKCPLREVFEIYRSRDSSTGLDLEFSFPLYQALLELKDEVSKLSA